MLVEWVKTEGPYRIAQTHRPRAGLGLEEDLSLLRALGADVLVCCLTDDELGRMSLQREPETAARVGLDFRRFPIRDHDLPDSLEDAVAFADGLVRDLEAGRSVVAHCFAGIGRSGLMVVTTLVRAGMGLEEAIHRASEARGLPVPETPGQLAWLSRVPRPHLDGR